ncbi:MAG: thioredoxin domain-containing protein [Magnetococcales bacterium]|nr:thioredoxin domain-containing protein [Magnetococcales bacterium]MBF0151291.1 thioredoxin domain-containing protein [Magnetococcales bacterium]
MNRKILFISVGGALLLIFFVAMALFQEHKAGQQSASTRDNMAALHREGAPIKGPHDAKVTIVEFFDPACETCREFHPLVAQLIEQYPGKVKVEMRYAPLHPGSDQVVAMLEAAHRQGKFWQSLELLFGNQSRWVIEHQSQPMRAHTLLGTLEVDRKRLSEDMNHPEVVQVVQQDVQDGQRLNVRATPEFFVNGRPMPSFGFEQLSLLVKEAVADAY